MITLNLRSLAYIHLENYKVNERGHLVSSLSKLSYSVCYFMLIVKCNLCKM